MLQVILYVMIRIGNYDFLQCNVMLWLVNQWWLVLFILVNDVNSVWWLGWCLLGWVHSLFHMYDGYMMSFGLGSFLSNEEIYRVQEQELAKRKRRGLGIRPHAVYSWIYVLAGLLLELLIHLIGLMKWFLVSLKEEMSVWWVPLVEWLSVFAFWRE